MQHEALIARIDEEEEESNITHNNLVFTLGKILAKDRDTCPLYAYNFCNEGGE